MRILIANPLEVMRDEDGGYRIPEIRESRATDEVWIDQGTGIMFELRGTTDGTTYTLVELLSTTADLTEAGAYVSVQ